MRLTPVFVAVLAFPAGLAAQQPPAPPQHQFSPMEVDAASQDPKSYTLDAASVQLVRTGGGGGSAPAARAADDDPIGAIDRIVNLAKKIFDIIKENQPVVDVKTSFADAVPEGATNPGSLSGWSAPESTAYRLSAKNLYGVTVIDCAFQVLRQHSGSYRGKGKFLTSVSILPEHVSVAWGYRFGMTFEAPSVANVGTAEDPVASMVADVNWSIATVIKHDEGNATYYLTGDGGFRELGGALRDQAREEARATVEKASQRTASLW